MVQIVYAPMPLEISSLAHNYKRRNQMKGYTRYTRFFRKILDWESWPFFLLYFPVFFVWIYYAIRSRSFWFFSIVNPTIEFGGFVGESKKEMYEQLPSGIYPETAYVEAQNSWN